ncbi:MAG: SMP-30/gluconolactonase/LRE family protein [Pseudomonadota bacterium]
MTIEVECVVPAGAMVGEGAVWDDRLAVLWWVDIPAGLIHCFDPKSGRNTTVAFGEPVGCLAVREAGGLVLAAKTGFWFFDPVTGTRRAIHDPEENLPQNRFNDGATDAQGRFWAGTMNDGAAGDPGGSFYRLDPDLSVTHWRGGIHTTNGLAFSPDGRRMYFSDSHPKVRSIWVSDYDTDRGVPGEPALFLDTNTIPGRPDGGTVDAEGCYWQAGVSGWQIYRISPAGEILLTIDMPVEKPSKPMFGGPGLDTLYVTSIGTGVTPGSAHRQPDAGGLFAIHGLGIHGVRQTRFAG